MSLFGSLRTSYPPATTQIGRMPTVSDNPSDGGQGNGGNEFLSLVDGGTSASDGTSTGKLSIYSALSPQDAYRASLIGSLLDGGTSENAGGDKAADDPAAENPIGEITGDLEAGATVSYEASDADEVTSGLQSDRADNTLPKADDTGDEEVESPIAAEGTVTNALPKMDAPPA